MTHSNHRRGSRKSLLGDWVVLVRGDVGGKPEEMKRIMEIFGDHNPIGLIKKRSLPAQRWMKNWKEGMGLREIVENPDPPVYAAGVYTEKDDVEGVIRDLEREEQGLCIVVSGIFDEVFDICKKTGTGPHTVNLSMETIGRTELLPDERILDIETMCGHSLVGEHLTRHLIDRVRKGKMTAEEAGLELGKQCVCNYFNQHRAAEIIEEYIAAQR
jgi:hypothetical protein